MPESKEDAAARSREYYKTPAGKKNNRIRSWKRQGIISEDYDALHERFMTTTHCEKCDVLLTAGRGRTGKCLDHDHDIKDRPNVRAVLCRACNLTDRCDNTSGVPNVSYCKGSKLWVYLKVVDGVPHCKHFKTKEEAIRYKYEYEDQTTDIT
jgi:hypothetical protein